MSEIKDRVDQPDEVLLFFFHLLLLFVNQIYIQFSDIIVNQIYIQFSDIIDEIEYRSNKKNCFFFCFILERQTEENTFHVGL